MTDHPITPPHFLVKQWLCTYFGATVTGEVSDVELALATQAARWGADVELEACCEWLKAKEWIHPEFSDELRAARRPKPKSLAEEALETLMQADGADHPVPVLVLPVDEAAKIRRALERLQELEGKSYSDVR